MANKFYCAVNGRDGPFVIYKNWTDTWRAVKGQKKCKHKSFPTADECVKWMECQWHQVKIFAAPSSPPPDEDQPKDEKSEEKSEEKPQKERKKRKIYTDGGCANNGTDDAIAGVGIVFPEMKISMRLPGAIQTNQRAELLAATLGLVGANSFDLIHTDSMYVVNLASKTSSDSNANTDLVDMFMAIKKHRPDVGFEYVPAHTGIPGNEEADRLASAAILSK